MIYRPETELASHYFQAVLPAQFDEYIWFDETRAVTRSRPRNSKGFPIPIHLACEADMPAAKGIEYVLDKLQWIERNISGPTDYATDGQTPASSSWCPSIASWLRDEFLDEAELHDVIASTYGMRERR